MSTVTMPALPPVRPMSVAQLHTALRGAPRLAVLDDDPTGTQTVCDLPVLTRWDTEDIRWALRQDYPAFFVLTNTRSLSAEHAAARVREVVEHSLAAARETGDRLAFASRSDSTLRGHYPLETDVISQVLSEHGTSTNAVVLAPAYLDAGRITVDGVHYLLADDKLLPVADSEFAADATFGYRSSRLAEWVEEKSGGRIAASAVEEITVRQLRSEGPDLLRGRLTGPGTARVIVLDAIADDDLRVAVMAIGRAERDGATFVYRCGPSFVRARSGQDAARPLDDATLRALVDSPAPGLIVAGSHVGRTSRQLAELSRHRAVHEVELDVPALLDPARFAEHVKQVEQTVGELVAGRPSAPVVLRTSRSLITGRDSGESLDIARRVSAALAGAVSRVVARHRPAYIVAKGGITSSDIATQALGIARARVRGSMLPGIVSLWEPDAGPAAGLPYVVFAGNVGDDRSLSDVVDRLEAAR
jgi:uncharacterized protein YgbK (DUF1537 family)